MTAVTLSATSSAFAQTSSFINDEDIVIMNGLPVFHSKFPGPCSFSLHPKDFNVRDFIFYNPSISSIKLNASEFYANINRTSKIDVMLNQPVENIHQNERRALLK